MSPTKYQRYFSYKQGLANFTVSLALFAFGCGNISKMSTTTNCDSSPDAKGCSRTQKRTFVLTTNPATVTLTNANVDNSISFSSGDMKGLVFDVQKNSFQAPLTITFADRDRETAFSLFNRLKGFLGLDASRTLSIKGDKPLEKEALLTLPSSHLMGRSEQELKVMRLKLSDDTTNLASTIYNRSDFKESVSEGQTRYSLAVKSWGRYSLEFDSEAPSLSLVGTVPSSTAARSLTLILKASETLASFKKSDLVLENATATEFSQSGLNYTISLTPTPDSTVTLKVPAGVIQDLAGNPSTSDLSISFKSDTTAPTITQFSAENAYTASPSFNVSLIFSEAVTGFDVSDLIVSGGVASSFTGSGAQYSVTITPSVEGTVSMNVPASSAVDATGNGNLAATTLTRVHDSVAPVPTISSAATATTNISPIPVSVTFSETVNGVTLDDFTISGGTSGNFSGSGSSYSFDITPAGMGTVTVDLASGRVQDAAGNGNTVATQLTRVYNNINPIPNLTTNSAAATANPATTVTATFSASVTGFTAGDLTLTNANISGFSGSGTTYTFTLTASAEGPFSASVPINVAVDGSSNGNTVSNTLALTYDATAPAVVISSSATPETNSSPVPFQVTFNEDVSGFDLSDISVSGGTKGNFNSINGSTYSFEILPSGQGSVTANVPGGAAVDAAGNSNTAAAPLTRTYDTTVPTVTLASTATGPTAVAPIPVTITFTEPVTGFSITDISVSGGTASGFTGSGTSYSVDITPSGAGNLTVSVANGVAQDSAANSNTASSNLTLVYDLTSPTPGGGGAVNTSNVQATSVTISWAAASDTVTGSSSLLYELRQSSSNNMSNLAAAETNGTIARSYSSTTSANIIGLGFNNTYYYVVIVKDEAGNKALYSSSSVTTADHQSPSAGGGSTVSADSVTATDLTLNWAAATDDVTAGSSLEYFVCYGASPTAIDTVSECEGATSIMNWTANTITKAISGLSPLTTNVYNVIVRDSAGNKTAYTPVSQTTTADVTAPSTGSFGAASTVTATGFTLSWTASSDNVTIASALQYFVCSGTASTDIDTVSECEAATPVMAYTASTLSYSITGKTPSTVYYYNVMVRDAAGNKSLYAGTSQSTAADTTAPTAGTSGASTNISATGFTLNWSSASDDATAGSALQYLVCSDVSPAAIDTAAECETAASIEMPYSTDVLTLNVSGLTPATTYYFNIVAKDAAGNKAIYSGISQATTMDSTAPTPGASGAVSASSVTSTSLSLSWTSASDAVTSAGHLLYFVCSGANAAAIDTVTECESATTVMTWTANTTTLPVTGLVANTTYYYNVLVKDTAGNKQIYAGVSQATSSGPDSTPPTVGSISASTYAGATSLSLNWTAASDDVTAVASLSYYVCSGVSIAAIDSVSECEAATMKVNWTTNITTTLINGLSPSSTHFFNVLVRDAAGNKSAYEGRSDTTSATMTTATNALRPNDAGHSFYDTVNGKHWLIFQDGANVSSRVSNDATTWTASTDLSANIKNMKLHYKAISGSGYVFLVGQENTYDITIRRGLLSSTSITWGSSVTVFDGTSATSNYANPTVVTDDTNVWVSASWLSSTSRLWTSRVRQSTNAANASLASWSAAVTVGAATSSARTATLLHRNAEDLYLVFQEQSTIVGYTYTDSTTTWALASSGAGYGWLSIPGTGETNSEVKGLAVVGDVLYAGGNFTSIGGNTISYLAKWDGSSWSAVGGYINGPVNDLETNGSDLYIAGIFTQVGGIPAAGIAKWNGASWSALGNTTSAPIYDLAIDGSTFYVTGNFTTIGGISAQYIAQWDGTAWSALGSGLNNTGWKLKLIGSNLYVGGVFTTAGGTTVNRIAKWNGSAWSALGTGTNGSVYALASIGTDLYAGGSFTTAGGNSTGYLAKWSGGSWSAVGSNSFTGGWVSSLLSDGTDLYLTGPYTVGGVTINGVGKWDGSNYSPLGSSSLSNINTIIKYGTDLVVGGNFSGAINHIARWNGSAWSGFTAGLNGSVNAVAFVGTDLYVGGDFTRAGGSSANRIAKWNGTSWSNLTTGAVGTVYALVSSGSDLYVGGSFTTAGGVTVNNIAKWNGTSWSALGTGVDSTVTSLIMHGGNLYVGGNFTSASGVTCNNIAKWDGTSWSALTSGTNAAVNALASDGTNLYVGGDFTTAGGSSRPRIAKWNGTAWSSLGTGIDAGVKSLAIAGGVLYAAGSFSTAGGVSALRLAQWNGTSWSALGSGINSGSASYIATDGTNIVIAGGFNLTAGGPDIGLALWNGASFQSLGSNSLLCSTLSTGTTLYSNCGASLREFKSATALATSAINFSASTNSLGEAMILYTDGLGGVYSRSHTSGTWAAPVAVQTSGSPSSPILTSVTGSDNAYGLWYRAGVLEFKHYSSGVWDASPSSILASGSRQAACDLVSSPSLIKCLTTSGTSAPYTLGVTTFAP